ncbi:protein lin-37 homolog [Topomyia yanbarensis]|uniref:protein lin-37 homolog n=1 Tax=Topomyia yanbarensis TaxID=2498891 RepID=UPI00273AECED|nr:protein lin-37 homolog [Topomyia yanbarensis]
MSQSKFPSGQSLLKVNRYALLQPAPLRRPPPLDPSIPLRGRPSKRAKMEYMSAGIRHQHSSSFIMKLFDRSVDLARFEPESSLYPVCRAWMRNQPRARVNQQPNRGGQQLLKKRVPLPDIVDRYNRKEIDYIDQMPKPDESKMEPFVFEKPLEKSKVGEFDRSGASRETLLKEHKERWVTIRQRWQSHRQNYLRKYQVSYDLLDAIVMKHT